MKLIYLVAIFVSASFLSTCLADASQNDWSGGPGVFGPVTEWNSTFHSCDSIRYGLMGVIEIEMNEITYIDRVDVQSVNCPRGVVVFDFDQDGDNDIIFVISTGGDCILLENEDGTGGTWTNTTIASFPRPYQASICNIDNDNDYDVVVSSAPIGGIGGLYWLKNSVGAWETICVEDTLLNPMNVEVGDINSDGRQDLVVSAHDEPAIYWFECMNSSGTIWDKHMICNGIIAYRISSGDLDGDGDIDVVAGEKNTDRMYWWENTNYGTSWIEHLLVQDLNNPITVAISDIDMDGHEDIVIGEYDPAPNIGLGILYGEGGGVFSDMQVLGDTLTWIGEILIDDLDEDGDKDILIAYNSCMTVYRNEGANNWEDIFIIDNLSEPTGLSSDDVTGDTRKDLIFAENNNDIVSYYKGSYGYLSEGVLNSSILDAGEIQWDWLWEWVILEYETPVGTDLSIQVRSSNTPDTLGIWSPELESGAWIGDYCGYKDRYFQYRINLSTSDSTVTPIVNEFGVSFSTGISDHASGLAVNSLKGAIENPSNAVALIRFSLAEEANIKISIYDISGREIRRLVEGTCSEGIHNMYTGDLSTGVYIIRIETPVFEASERFVIL